MAQLDTALSVPEGLTIRLSEKNVDVAEIFIAPDLIACVALRDLTHAVYELSNERLMIRTSQRHEN